MRRFIGLQWTVIYASVDCKWADLSRGLNYTAFELSLNDQLYSDITSLEFARKSKYNLAVLILNAYHMNAVSVVSEFFFFYRRWETISRCIVCDDRKRRSSIVY